MDTTSVTGTVDLENVDSIIYVHGPLSQSDLVDGVAAAVDGEVHDEWVEGEGATLVVDRNSDADRVRAEHRPEGFLYFDYRVEVYFVPSIVLRRRISTVGALLQAFWAEKWAAVAANHYEPELPYEGGAADDGSLPWPGRDLQ